MLMAEKSSQTRGNLICFQLTTTSPTWTGLGLNWCLRVERLGTNDLSHGTALSEQRSCFEVLVPVARCKVSHSINACSLCSLVPENQSSRLFSYFDSRQAHTCYAYFIVSAFGICFQFMEFWFMTGKTAGSEQCRARYAYLHEAINETGDLPT